MSPYLFILCAEVLSGLIASYHDQGIIHGITIARNASAISHLFFVDDSMIFFGAHKNEAQHLMEIFAEYQRISEQKINLNKSELVFSPNILQGDKTDFQSFMPIQIIDNITKYLGLPTHIGRPKNHIFNFIMDGVRSKLKGWKEKNLSFSGRGCLLKFSFRLFPPMWWVCS